jgi:mRNA-degrading endonuclease RelE of RelBE toxin-antitoxin system
VRAGLDAIRHDPAAGKPLRDDLVGLWSFRVGRFRIIYRPVDTRVVELVTIGPRRTIHEETARRIRRDRKA